MRVLFLASYFPKPTEPTMGVWALEQAQALQRAGVDLRVLSFTSWLPPLAAFWPRARPWVLCPPNHEWGSLKVHYPRWLLYQVEPLKTLALLNPTCQMSLAWWSARAAVSRLLGKWKPDIVFAHHAATNGFIALQLRRIFGIPFVVVNHAFEEITASRHLPKLHAHLRPVLEEASAVVSISRRMELILKEVFPLARSRIVHNGATRREQPRLRPSSTSARIVVFSAGKLYPLRQMPLLVRAFARVTARHPNAVLRIAGDGQERREVEAVIQECRVGDRVSLLGLISHEAVLDEMNACDIFALLSRDELWGVVYAEAMAASKPIVYCDDGGINDVAENGVHGLAVAPGDLMAAAAALDELMADGERRRLLGLNGLHLFERELTWDANAQALGVVFEDCLAAK